MNGSALRAKANTRARVMTYTVKYEAPQVIFTILLSLFVFLVRALAVLYGNILANRPHRNTTTAQPGIEPKA